MTNFGFKVNPKFWTLDKLVWLRCQPDFKFRDEDAKKDLAERFNAWFNSNKSVNAIYNKFRKQHPCMLVGSGSRKSKPRIGNCRRGIVRTAGIAGSKVDGKL